MEEIVGSIYVSPEVYWLLNKNKGKVNFRKLRSNSYCYLFNLNFKRNPMPLGNRMNFEKKIKSIFTLK